MGMEVTGAGVEATVGPAAGASTGRSKRIYQAWYDTLQTLPQQDTAAYEIGAVRTVYTHARVNGIVLQGPLCGGYWLLLAASSVLSACDSCLSGYCELQLLSLSFPRQFWTRQESKLPQQVTLAQPVQQVKVILQQEQKHTTEWQQRSWQVNTKCQGSCRQQVSTQQKQGAGAGCRQAWCW